MSCNFNFSPNFLNTDSFSNTNKIQKISSFASLPLTFRGHKHLENDTFECSKNEIYKTKIKDLKGNEIEAQIVETKSDNPFLEGRETKFTMNVDGKYLGYAIVQDNRKKDKLELVQLYTEENEHRSHKGAGVELLKRAVTESQKRGYDGAISLHASHTPSPVAFYYKNNFVIPAPKNDNILYQAQNASIQYSISNNIPFDKMVFPPYNSAYMELTPGASKAFMRGEKLYKERIFETIDEKNIDGNTYDTTFIQSPNEKEYFVLATNKTSKTCKANLVVVLKEKEENNKKYFVIRDFFDYCADDGVMDFALQSVRKLQQQGKCDEILISKDMSRYSKRLYEECNEKFSNE